MTKIRKSTFLGLMMATAISTTTFAHSAFYKSGFIAGGQVGASFGSGNYKSTLVPPAAANLPNVSANGNISKTAFLIGLLGGYRHVLNDGFTVGVNIEGNLYTNNELNKNFLYSFPGGTDTYNYRVKKNYDVIASFLVGKVFCERYHVSLGLGLGMAKFKQQLKYATPGNNFSPSQSSQTRVGFVPSVRLEYAATKNISFTGAVSYEMYKKLSKSYPNYPGIGENYNSSIAPRYLGIKVGAVYKF